MPATTTRRTAHDVLVDTLTASSATFVRETPAAHYGAVSFVTEGAPLDAAGPNLRVRVITAPADGVDVVAYRPDGPGVWFAHFTPTTPAHVVVDMLDGLDLLHASGDRCPTCGCALAFPPMSDNCPDPDAHAVRYV